MQYDFETQYGKIHIIELSGENKRLMLNNVHEITTEFDTLNIKYGHGYEFSCQLSEINLIVSQNWNELMTNNEYNASERNQELMRAISELLII